MSRSICLINGHPHDDAGHLCWALASAFEDGARGAGHAIERVDLARLDIPVLRDPQEFLSDPPRSIREVQSAVSAADHLALIYPLWLGTMPALVKAFFEQFARNEFAIAEADNGGWPRRMLKGRSARVIVTMGMPAAAYRVLFGAHGVKSLESGILGMAGFKPIRDTFIGGVGEIDSKEAEKHLKHMRELGASAD